MKIKKTISRIKLSLNLKRWRDLYLMKMDNGKKHLEYKKSYPNVLSTKDTIKLVCNEKKSLCRFGDGEFMIIYGKSFPFQKSTPEIRKKLKEILVSEKEKIVVAIPPFESEYNNSKNVLGNFSYWEVFWFFNFKKIIYFLNNKKIYGNTNTTRLDVFYENDIEEIKSIWNKKNVAFVYGENGRFDENSPIFNNVNDKKVILTKSTNAFDEYEIILSECLQLPKETLVLIACGPTATVLAYDLANYGYQAIDIGHIGNSYDQYLGKIDSPESLSFK